MAEKKRNPPLTKPMAYSRKDVSKAYKIKVATNNLFVSSLPPVNSDTMQSIILQDIGAQELITLSRHDLLTGQNVQYNIIKDLASAYVKYNPNTIIKLQGTDTQNQAEFAYVFNNYVPEVGTGISINGTLTGDIVYVDPTTGHLIINTINTNANQYVEIQFITYEDIIDDTIYI